MVVWTAATDALVVKAAVAELAPPEPAEPAEGEEAAEAEAVEPPEEKPPPTPLEAATALLASEEVKSAATKGASPAESFTLACEHLNLAPHPAIVKGQVGVLPPSASTSLCRLRIAAPIGSRCSARAPTT